MSMGAGTWSYAGVSFHRSTVTEVISVDGSLVPSQRRGSLPSPDARSGDIWAQRYWQGRRIVLALFVYPDMSQSDPRLAMYQQIDALNGAFSLEGLQDLVHNHPDGSTRTSAAEVVDLKVSRQPAETAAFYQCVVDFWLPDPWFYGSAAVVAGSGSFVITNPGSMTTESIVLAISGASNPVLANTTTGDSLSLAGSGSLTINAYERTAILNGNNAIGQLSHGGRRWLSLVPGDNALTFSGGTLALTYQAAYA